MYSLDNVPLVVMVLKSCWPDNWSGQHSCHPPTELLTALLLWRVVMVRVISRPWFLFCWLPNVTIPDTDVVQDRTTGNHLHRKERALA